MPTIICRNCGHTTNTALSDWVTSKDGKADVCYARLVENKWEEGCGYSKGDNFVKQYVKNLVRKDIASLRREANKISREVANAKTRTHTVVNKNY